MHSNSSLFNFFLPFFVYIIYEYVSIYKKRNPENLINIKADPFLEQFLKEIKDRHPAEGYILSIIICYCVSIVIFILAWILSHIFTKRYMKLMDKTGNQNSKKDQLLTE